MEKKVSYLVVKNDYSLEKLPLSLLVVQRIKNFCLLLLSTYLWRDAMQEKKQFPFLYLT